MANERDTPDDGGFLDPEDVSSPPSSAAARASRDDDRAGGDTPAAVPLADPAAGVPVPPVMWPAEVDKRAEVVEELREERTPDSRRDERDRVRDRDRDEGMR